MIIEKAIKAMKNLDEVISITVEEHESVKLAIIALTEKLNNRWIPITVRLPEAETEVEISIKRITERGTYYFTVRGFYEDGTIWNEDSSYNWEYDKTIHELDEERDDFKIPISWWEESTYADEYRINAIDDFVTAWRDVPLPYQQDKEKEINNG